MKNILTRFLEQSRVVLYDRDQPLAAALACLLARGHLLIEDVPGVGKTSFALLMARMFNLEYRRVQMTNDLLPGDVIGSSIFDANQSKFTFRPGPMFSHLLLADELNRASPRTQSAFLEAMEERKVSLDGITHSLPDPFFVIATQNPEEQAGTSPLPEGQLDRFLVSLRLGYPSREAEIRLLKEADPRGRIQQLEPIGDLADLKRWQLEVDAIHVSDHLAAYAYELLQNTRRRGAVLSPRSGQHLMRLARAFAWLDGRDHALPEDVKRAAPLAWSHRLGLGTRQGGERIRELLESTSIPV